MLTMRIPRMFSMFAILYLFFIAYDILWLGKI